MAFLKKIGLVAIVFFLALPAIAAAADAKPVGEAVEVAPLVEGGFAKQARTKLKNKSPLFVGMEIETYEKAGARLHINTDLPRQRGVVLLGPETFVQLTERLIGEAQGLLKIHWLVKLGQFLFALDPPSADAPLKEGEYLILTPDDGPVIRLTGTVVVVQVDRDGTTTVWVVEGKVSVEPKRGEPVEVSAGYGTRVRPGGAPERPLPFVPPQRPGPGPLPIPGETIFPDPPNFDLREIRLDVPG